MIKQIIFSRNVIFAFLFTLVFAAAILLFTSESATQAANPGFKVSSTAIPPLGSKINFFANLNLVIGVAQDGLATLNTTADTLNGRAICPSNPTAGCDFSQNNNVVRTNDSIVYSYDYSVNGASEDVTITATAPLGTTWNVLPAFCLSGSTLNGGNGTTVASVISCKRGLQAQGTSESLPFTVTVLGSTNNGTILTASGTVSGAASTTVTANAANVTVTAAPHFNLRKVFQTYSTFTFNSVAGYRIEYRATVEVFDDSVPAAYNPRFGSAALSSPLTFTDVVSQISPNALLQSCAKQSDNGGNGGTIGCTQSAAGQNISVTVTGANTTLSQYVVPPSDSRFTAGTYQIYVFIPATDVSNAPGQSLTTTNTLINFDPNSSAGQSNFDALTENTTDNVAIKAITSLTGSFGKAYVKDYNNANATSFGVAVGSNRFVASGEIFASQVSLNNNTGAALNNVVLCDVMDNSKYSVTESAPGSGIVYGNDTPAPTVVEFATGYVNANWLPTATGGNPAGIRTECNDAGIVWYSNPTQVPGGVAAITKFRVKYNTLANTAVGTVRVRVKSRDTNFYTGQTIFNGAVLPNFAIWRSDELNPNYINNTFYQNVYPNNSSGSPGARLFLARAIARITKETENNDTVNSIATGGTIGYVLKPTLATVGAPNPVQVSVLDVLPVGLSYIVGTGQQNAVVFEPQIINCTGNAAPDSHCTVAGQQLLLWTLNNQTPNVAIQPISFRAAADLTVLNNQTVTNTATVSSPADPSQEVNRTATRSVTGAAPSTLLIFKNSNTPQIETNTAMQYTVSYRNSSFTTDFNSLDFIDVFPFNGDANLNFEAGLYQRTPASNFNGTRTLTSLSATTNAPIWYFTNATAATVNISPKFSGNLNPGTNGSIWCAGTATGPAAGCGYPLSQVTAVRMQDNAVLLRNNSIRTFTLNFATSGNQLNNRYTNNSAGSAAELALSISSNNVPIVVLESSVSGLVWYDTNDDGIRGSEEIGRAAGLNVNLTGTDSGGNNVNRSTTTAVDGTYNFAQLKSGNYFVQFSRPQSYSTSPQDVGTDDTIDSDGNPSTLTTQTFALGVNNSKVNVDFGFYQTSLSGTIWRDTGAGANSNNGRIDADEAGRVLTNVHLFDSANNEIPVGADGILGTADDANSGVQTNAQGNYAFSGLPAGNYIVKVYYTGTSSAPTSTTPDDNVDSDDNGVPGTGADLNRIVSNPMTLTPGNAGVLNNNTVNNASGLTTNPTVDFGIIAGPTAIKLESFTGTVYSNGVALEWTTGAEVNNLGFRLFREQGGQRELLNKNLIAGSALITGANTAINAGFTYRWFDEGAASDAAYWLEDVDLSGSASVQQTAELCLAAGESAPNTVRSKSFAELNDGQRTQTERAVFAPLTQNFGAKEKRLKANVFAGGAAIKLAVKQTGWQRVERSTLLAAGLPENVNQTTLQLFADYTEQALRVTSDGIEFYGAGLNQPNTDTQVYWLVWNRGIGKRINIIDARGGENALPANFTSVVERRDRLFYVPAILNGESENFFGAIISNQAITQTVTLNHPDAAATDQVGVEVDLQGLSTQLHNVEIALNGTPLGAIEFDGKTRGLFRTMVDASQLLDGNNEFSLREQGGDGNVSLVEAVCISYAKLYRAENGQLRFSVPAGRATLIDGFASADVRVFDVTDADNVSELQVNVAESKTGYAVKLPAMGGERLFVAQDSTVSALQPVEVKANEPSNWRKFAPGADFVILTHRDFRQAATRLATARSAQRLPTVVVDVEDVYDEFNFGVKSTAAVREFFANANAAWQIKPQYLLLFGDASADERNYLGNGDSNFVPTKFVDTEFMESASDDLLTDFDGDGIANLGTGRLPVRTAVQADILVGKLLTAQSVPATDKINRRAVLVADTGFETQNGKVVALLNGKVPVTIINRADRTTEEARQQILNALNGGASIIGYNGHGSSSSWASNGLLRTEDASGLTNNRRLSLIVSMTCLNGYFADPNGDSLSEALLAAPSGGAYAVWSSSGLTYGEGQTPMNEALFREYANNSNQRIGDLLKKVKQATNDLNVRRTWSLLGDPTMRIR